MASQQRQGSANKESGHKRTAGAVPDEAQHINGNRPSEMDSKEKESFEQVGFTSKASLVKVLYQ